jgi:DNA-binding transcriptional ArsR family regulator
MPDEESEEQPPTLPKDLLMITDLETLKVMADPLRLQLLNLLREEPRTVKQLSRLLHLPQTKLYYHMDLLEKHKLVRIVATRLVSGILEKHYQATAYKFSVDYALLMPPPSAPSSHEGMDVFLSAVLDYTRSDIQRSLEEGLIELRKDVPPERRLVLGRRWMRLTPEQASAFQKRINELGMEFEAAQPAPNDPHAQLYEFLLGFYPTRQRPPAAPDEQ